MQSYQEKLLKLSKKDGFCLKIGHSIYLPEIDENTYKIDGSVRVDFKVTISGKNNVELSAYRTINFDNGKISGIWEWVGYGG